MARLATAAVFAIALGVVILAALAPLGVAAALADAPLGAPAGTIIDLNLLMRTIAVALAIAITAAALALPVAWWLRSASAALSALLIAPLFLPTYLVYASWGLARAPGTILGDWIEQGGVQAFRIANLVQALGGLSLWVWPIGALIIGVGARRISAHEFEALRCAAPKRRARALIVLRMLTPSILIAVAVMALLMLGSAIPLHVARVETYAITIWRLMNETTDPARIWPAALPLFMVALIAGSLLSWRMLRAGEVVSWRLESTSAPTGVIAAGALVWIASAALPAALFLWNLRDFNSLGKVAVLLAEPARQSMVVALMSGVGGLVVALASTSGFARGAAPSARFAACAVFTTLLVTALTPGVLIGAALHSASRYEGVHWLSEASAGMAAAHLLRFGFFAAVTGWWLARLEPIEAADLRRLEGCRSLLGWREPASGARLVAAAGAALVIFLLSVHEIESAIMLAPPGFQSLAQTLLNQLHYLRMEELSGAGVWLSIAGLAVVVTVAAATAFASRTFRRSFLWLLLIACAPLLSCENAAPTDAQPIHAAHQFSEVGSAPGQVIYPRAIDVDDDSIWIIDKSARVQRWSFDGAPITVWTMPASERGMPTGVSCGPDGLIYVADTHEHRVAVFSNTGDLVDTWGSYGQGDGQFIYPTDIAFQCDDQGDIVRIYVSEYGGNDRISVFNAAHEFLFAFGEEGSGEGADPVQMARPQSMLFDHERQELIVTDSSNHRVGRFTPNGELIAWIGAPGAMPGEAQGEFRYPYGLAMLNDGTIVVSEFGGNRVQRLDPVTGASLGLYGRPGFGDGELRTPWGLAAANDTVFVLDSGNHRVVEFDVSRQPRLAPMVARASAP